MMNGERIKVLKEACKTIEQKEQSSDEFEKVYKLVEELNKNGYIPLLLIDEIEFLLDVEVMYVYSTIPHEKLTFVANLIVPEFDLANRFLKQYVGLVIATPRPIRDLIDELVKIIQGNIDEPIRVKLDKSRVPIDLIQQFINVISSIVGICAEVLPYWCPEEGHKRRGDTLFYFDIEYTEKDIKEILSYYCASHNVDIPQHLAKTFVALKVPPRLIVRLCCSSTDGKIVKNDLIDELYLKLKQRLCQRAHSKVPDRLRRLLEEQMFYIDKSVAETVTKLLEIAPGNTNKETWAKLSRVLNELAKYGILERIAVSEYAIRKEIILAVTIGDETPLYSIDSVVKLIEKKVEDIRKRMREKKDSQEKQSKKQKSKY